MVVAGTVTHKMAPRVRRLWDQMSEPKWVIAMGACTVGGGPYFVHGYHVREGGRQGGPRRHLPARLPAAARRRCSSRSCACRSSSRHAASDSTARTRNTRRPSPARGRRSSTASRPPSPGRRRRRAGTMRPSSSRSRRMRPTRLRKAAEKKGEDPEAAAEAARAKVKAEQEGKPGRARGRPQGGSSFKRPPRPPARTSSRRPSRRRSSAAIPRRTSAQWEECKHRLPRSRRSMAPNPGGDPNEPPKRKSRSRWRSRRSSRTRARRSPRGGSRRRRRCRPRRGGGSARAIPRPTRFAVGRVQARLRRAAAHGAPVQEL